MRIKTKNDGRPEGCEWFAYASHLGAYPNCPDMNELSEIVEEGLTAMGKNTAIYRKHK